MRTKMIFIFILFVCCNKEKKAHNKISIQDTQDNYVLFSSSELAQYYEVNTHDEINIKEHNNSCYSFGDTLMKMNLKEDDFDFPKGEDYCEIYHHQFNESNTIQLIIYMAMGENDSQIFQTQLNSYYNNNLMDALLIDCRFEFEVKYFRDFKINNDKSISIIKKWVELFEYDEDYNIIGEKKQREIQSDTVTYFLNDKGIFIEK